MAGLKYHFRQQMKSNNLYGWFEIHLQQQMKSNNLYDWFEKLSLTANEVK